MKSEQVYEKYLKKNEPDYELLSLMQKECFNKRVKPAEVIDYKQLGDMLSQDKRFNDPRIIYKWWWIFDTEYAVISFNLIGQMINELNDINNPWTVVAIVQSVTGLNSGFVGLGRYVVNDVISKIETECCGFITDSGIKVYVYENRWKEVKEGEFVVGFAIFD